MSYTIEVPDDWSVAENTIAQFFPRMSVGVLVNDKYCLLVKNNIENKFDIDWAIHYGDEIIAVVDTEHKPEWRFDPYPLWSVARRTYAYNKGLSLYPRETTKVHYFRQYPDESFWMPIKSDYTMAGIVKGGVITNSKITFRPQPRGFVRDIEIFEFTVDKLIFGEPYKYDIEDYILKCLDEAGQL